MVNAKKNRDALHDLLRQLVDETAGRQGRHASQLPWGFKALAEYCRGRMDAAVTGAHQAEWMWLCQWCEASDWRLDAVLDELERRKELMRATKSTGGLTAAIGGPSELRLWLAGMDTVAMTSSTMLRTVQQGPPRWITA